MTNHIYSQDKPSLDELAHHGIKGMHWGVRKDNYTGASSSTNAMARKDAQEFARAKMSTGEGAGNRRKLIKAKVESAAKKNPTYKAAFEHHLALQDLGVHATKATAERRRRTAVKSTTKTARGVHRQLTGGFGSVSAASALLATGYVAARSTGIDKVIINAGKSFIRDIRTPAGNRSSGMSADELLRSLGVIHN